MEFSTTPIVLFHLAKQVFDEAIAELHAL